MSGSSLGEPEQPPCQLEGVLSSEMELALENYLRGREGDVWRRAREMALERAVPALSSMQAHLVVQWQEKNALEEHQAKLRKECGDIPADALPWMAWILTRRGVQTSQWREEQKRVLVEKAAGLEERMVLGVLETALSRTIHALAGPVYRLYAQYIEEPERRRQKQECLAQGALLSGERAVNGGCFFSCPPHFVFP